MVSVFPDLCLWRRSLRSNLGGIDPEKLYRATLNALRYIVSRMQHIKGSTAIFIMNKVIVIAPDAVWPVLEENNFSEGVSGLSQRYVMSIPIIGNISR